jgi:hypothetical protein
MHHESAHVTSATLLHLERLRSIIGKSKRLLQLYTYMARFGEGRTRFPSLVTSKTLSSGRTTRLVSYPISHVLYMSLAAATLPFTGHILNSPSLVHQSTTAMAARDLSRVSTVNVLHEHTITACLKKLTVTNGISRI